MLASVLVSNNQQTIVVSATAKQYKQVQAPVPLNVKQNKFVNKVDMAMRIIKSRQG